MLYHRYRGGLKPRMRMDSEAGSEPERTGDVPFRRGFPRRVRYSSFVRRDVAMLFVPVVVVVVVVGDILGADDG